MKRLIVATLYALSCLSSVCAWAQADSEAALAAVLADHERLARHMYPISAGREGDREALHRWPDVSPRGQDEARERLRDLRRRLERIDASGLSPASALNHRLLVRAIDQTLDHSSHDPERLAFRSDSGFHTTPDYVARTTTISTREEAEAWLARLEALPGYYRQNIENLRRGIRTRVTQPRIVVERVLEVARKQAQTEPQRSVFLMPIARATSLNGAAREAHRTKALQLIEARVRPVQREFVQFLEREYLPAARKHLGIRSVPGGEAMYRALVRYETTTDLSPDEVHALGLGEVARIRALMEECMRKSGFDGTFAEFLQMLRTDPRFYAKTPQELLEKASEIAKRADDRLPPLFGTLPRLPYGVRPVPDEIAEGYTTGRYWLGSMANGQAGGYMVNTSHLDQRPLYELPALTLHEAVPGHHLQIALAQELGDLPYFRRHWSLTAFVEGWGLYAEMLGEEMGMYRDAYELFGRYSYEMWRACRLVADTGIHWLGWDIERARACFTENSALAPHNIQTELERYISWPAQALAYKVGELRLRTLREEAQQRLGERFDIRAFHDLILLGGPIPLDVLEERVKDWIDRGGAHAG